MREETFDETTIETVDVSAFVPDEPSLTLLESLTKALGDAGGRTVLVGGCVRDGLLGRPSHDIDVEVRGIPADRLQPLLRRVFQKVDLVGSSFAVFKASTNGIDFDVALPRTEVKSGEGHTGFDVAPDPYLSDEAAAARRDFTVNSIGYDVQAGKLVDPLGGVADLGKGILRASSPAFAEDPLRVLRAARFSSQLGFNVESQTASFCASLLSEKKLLPAERVLGEYVKLFNGARPSMGLSFLNQVGWGEPEVINLPEADFKALCQAADRAVSLQESYGNTDPDTLEFLTVARSLALVGMALPTVELDRLVSRLTRERHALSSVRSTRDAAQLILKADGREWDEKLRFAAEKTSGARLPLIVAGSVSPSLPVGELVEKARQGGVLDSRLTPLVDGQDVLAAGATPGPVVGQVLAVLRLGQLSGLYTTREQSLAAVPKVLEDSRQQPHARTARGFAR